MKIFVAFFVLSVTGCLLATEVAGFDLKGTLKKAQDSVPAGKSDDDSDKSDVDSSKSDVDSGKSEVDSDSSDDDVSWAVNSCRDVGEDSDVAKYPAIDAKCVKEVVARCAKV